MFAQVSDPHAHRGMPHRVATVLTLAACAGLAEDGRSSRSPEWAADTDPATRTDLGVAGPVPDPAETDADRTPRPSSAAFRYGYDLAVGWISRCVRSPSIGEYAKGRHVPG